MLKRKTAALSGGKKYYSFIQLKKSWIHWLIDWYWLFLNVFELSLIKLTTLCYCWTFQADTLNLCSNILCQIFPVNYESCTMKIHVGPLFYKKKDGSPHQYFHSVSIEDLASGYATESQLGCGNLGKTRTMSGTQQWQCLLSTSFLLCWRALISKN